MGDLDKLDVEQRKQDVSTCGTDATNNFEKTNGVTERKSASDENGINHNACRMQEKAHLTDKVAKCNDFQTYAAGLSPPACTADFPKGPSDETEACLEKGAEWFAIANATY